MKVLATKVLAVAAIVGGTIFSASGAAHAAGLSSNAPVAGHGKASNPYENGPAFKSQRLIDIAVELAKLNAKNKCASGDIKYKHLKVTNVNYNDDRSNKMQVAEATIYTRCW